MPDYFDNSVGSEGGRDLSAIGPQSASLASLITNDTLTTQLVSTFLWQSYIGRQATGLIGRTGKAGAGEKAPIIYIVRHGRGQPRHDLLIFDPQIPDDQVKQGYVEVSPSELRAGWRSFRDAYGVTNASIPPWLSQFNLQNVPEIAVEAMNAQRHFFIAMHPPRIVWTSGAGQNFPRIPSGALAVSKRANGKSLSTAGVISSDDKGRTGVTTALHAFTKHGASLFVEGVAGNVRARDTITDSCFIEVTFAKLPPCGSCCGPLSGVTPGRGEEAWFDGITSGKVQTHIDGWTPELPWSAPGIQSRIITPPVTDGGDSGAALVSKSGTIIGFAHYRTGFNAKSPHSAWIWAESVFSALHLQ